MFHLSPATLCCSDSCYCKHSALDLLGRVAGHPGSSGCISARDALSHACNLIFDSIIDCSSTALVA